MNCVLKTPFQALTLAFPLVFSVAKPAANLAPILILILPARHRRCPKGICALGSSHAEL